MNCEDYFYDRYRVDVPLAKTTVGTYRAAARAMDRWFARNGLAGAGIPDLDIETMNRFLMEYAEGRSVHTTRSVRKILIALINHHLAPQHITIESKFIRLPKPVATVKDSWSLEEVRRLVEAADGYPAGREYLGGLLPETLRSDYLRNFLTFIWETAARRGDAVRLQIADVKSGRSFNFIQSKSKRAVVYKISDNLRADILKMPHVIAGHELAFPLWSGAAGGSKMQLSVMAKHCMKYAGLSASDSCLKKLRRSSITDVERSKPGTGFLHAGHSSPAVTAEHYIDKSRAYADRPTPESIEENDFLTEDI